MLCAAPPCPAPPRRQVGDDLEDERVLASMHNLNLQRGSMVTGAWADCLGSGGRARCGCLGGRAGGRVGNLLWVGESEVGWAGALHTLQMHGGKPHEPGASCHSSTRCACPSCHCHAGEQLPERSSASFLSFFRSRQTQLRLSGQAAAAPDSPGKVQPARTELPTPADRVQPPASPEEQPPPLGAEEAAAAEQEVARRASHALASTPSGGPPPRSPASDARGRRAERQPPPPLQPVARTGSDSRSSTPLARGASPLARFGSDACAQDLLEAAHRRSLERLQQQAGGAAAPAGGLSDGEPDGIVQVPQVAQHQLTRWRSDAVQLEELLRLPAGPGAGEASPLARMRVQQAQQAPGSARAAGVSVAAQLQQAAPAEGLGRAGMGSGPSVLATLPAIPDNSFSTASHRAESSASAVACEEEQQEAGQRAERLRQGQQGQQQHIPPQPQEPQLPEALLPRRATAPPQLPHRSGSSGADASGYVSAPGSSRAGAAGPGAGLGLGPGRGRIARSASEGHDTLLGRATSAPASSFEAFASAGVKLRGGVAPAGLYKAGLSPLAAGLSGTPAPFQRMATTGARASGGVGGLRRLDSNVDLTNPETAALAARIRKKLDRPVSDRLLQVGPGGGVGGGGGGGGGSEVGQAWRPLCSGSSWAGGGAIAGKKRGLGRMWAGPAAKHEPAQP